MKEERYHIALDDYEHGVVICSRSFQSNHANAFVCFCKIQNNIINFLF